MIKLRPYILFPSVAIGFLLLFSLCSAKQSISNTTVIKNMCDSVVFNNGFSQMPLGKSMFGKTYLVDTLFSEFKREECVIHEKGNEEINAITFYSGLSSYFTFYKQYQRDEYFLYTFELLDEAVLLTLNKENKFGINFTKDYLSNALSFSNNLCDKVFISNEDRTVDVVIYFQDNKIKRINYLTYL